MTLIPNPLLKHADSHMSIPQGRKIGLHCGFHTYLFDSNNNRSLESKYDLILAHIRRLLENFDGFSIMICGHSLGGALATLCTFRMAVEEVPVSKKPITCITFASPRTGNIQFVRAF